MLLYKLSFARWSTRLRYWALSRVVAARRQEVANQELRLAHARVAFERAYHPLRLLEAQHLWLKDSQ